jgi:hypothetical protein
MIFETMTDEDIAARIVSLRADFDAVRALGAARAATGTADGYADGNIANERARVILDEIKALNFEFQLRASSGTPSPTHTPVRPHTWDELQDALEKKYTLEKGHGMWPTIRIAFDDGRSQRVTVRPRGAPERGRVEITTGFARSTSGDLSAILGEIYDLAFGGAVRVGDDLCFRDTFLLGALTMDELDDLLVYVATIGDMLEEKHATGDLY